MNLREYERLIIENIKNLQVIESNKGDGSEKSYVVTNANNIRKSIEALSVMSMADEEIKKITSLPFYGGAYDEYKMTYTDLSTLKSYLYNLSNGLLYLLKFIYNQNINLPEESLAVKLPEIGTFEDLAKVANDLKKAIEIPILDQNEGGRVQILNAESGSIWLDIGIYSTKAIVLIGAICKAAVYLRTEIAKAKIFEEHARTFGLKNDAMKNILDMQKSQIEQILKQEAKNVLNENYQTIDEQTEARLKLSISTFSDLIEKGAMILPATKANGFFDAFPDVKAYKSIAENTTKKITDREGTKY